MKVSLYKGLLFWLVVSLSVAEAQERHSGVFNQAVMPGPGGVWIMVYDSVAQVNPAAGTEYVISRDDQRGRGYRKLASLNFPASADDLEKRLGKTLTQEILRESNLQTVDELLSQARSGRYGVFGKRLFTPAVLQALGLLYIDNEVKKRTERVSYRVERVVNGTQQVILERSLRDVQYDPFPEFRSQRKLVSDSVIMITWFSLSGQAAFADVINTDGRTGSVADRIWVYQRNDTLFATYSKVTRPGEQVSLYIRPTDLPGNTGQNSDTVNLIAASFGDRLMVTNLVAADTLGGVLLTWDRLPAKAWFTGIRILKSRSATENFILVDTLPSSTSHWVDRNTINGVQYYYIVEPLVFDLPQTITTTPAHATVHIRRGSRNVMTPQSVSLEMTPERNVRISWMPNSELDVFAYYVLRGTSRENMEVVSEGIRDTVYVDSLHHLSGGVSYQYGVIATDMDLNSSDTSALVSVILPKARSIPSVGGLSARYTEQGVRLFWTEATRNDASIIGYLLYIRMKGEQYFSLVTDSVIQGTFFLDQVNRKPGIYEYGCATIDAWSNQSILSAVAEVSIPGTAHLYPPADFDVRNTPKGIEVRIPETAGEEGIADTRSYVIYRCLADGKFRWQKIGETTTAVNLFVDQKVVRDQLYVYAVSIKQSGGESVKSVEKSIRRK